MKTKFIHEPKMSRRRLLAGLGAGAATLAAGTAARAACSVTAWQVDGPFYPQAITDQDWDMTHVSGSTTRAAGTVIEVTGKVIDANCNPVPGCVLEVWQANHKGRYQHPLDAGDENRPMDPNFQGYARIVADNNGEYRFVSIRPASYAAIGDWIRPAHIHFKAHAAFNPSVTTQMYFSDDPLNDKDLLLQDLSPAEQAGLIVAFNDTRADGVPTGQFNITLPTGWMPPAELITPGQN
jgi:protocatechuate 3,4-dioxygenase beta subunit